MIRGLVQGVGFRPFICRMAARHNLNGEVDNRTDGVAVIVQGDIRTIDNFSNDILQNAPPASQIKSIEVNTVECPDYSGFSIVASKNVEDRITEISPDIAVCPECLEDMMKDPGRIDYPFINCTNCGPRFSIISKLPYDRPSTTMKDFRMCSRCNTEYTSILDRRFHAQPIACNSCGPVYHYLDEDQESGNLSEILKYVAALLDEGKSVAIKGTGGYFLMCDALNNEAVKGLRRRKQRDSKPFAVMFRDVADVRKYCYLNQVEEKELRSWRRPIVILKQKTSFCDGVNSGLNTIGAMLPYMPFHYLLFRSIQTPAVVLTSGNLSDEPIITDDHTAREKLMPVAGALLSYNREILNRVDDSIVAVIDKKVSILRRSRGHVPRPFDLDFETDGILALGAEEKNTFCVGKGRQAIMSQHIGDLKSPATYDFLRSSIDRFKILFRFSPSFLACDMHPDYFSSRFAEKLHAESNIPMLKIQHHHAHIASCMAESGLDDQVIGVAFDGTGLGTDGNIWGSEFMVADLENFRRISHFDYVPMPGGDKAVQEPWRMAYSYIYKYYRNNFDYYSLPVFKDAGMKKLDLIQGMIENNINTPLSSGAGRVFDAVSALTGLCAVAAFDAEAPMRLEAAIKDETDDTYPFIISENVDFNLTLRAIVDDLKSQNISIISAKFHNTIAKVVLDMSVRIREEFSINKVVLSGGVFQNRYLLEKALSSLNKARFRVYVNRQVPVNDGGISLGQLIIASKNKKYVS